jgi:hypothetical protein
MGKQNIYRDSILDRCLYNIESDVEIDMKVKERLDGRRQGRVVLPEAVRLADDQATEILFVYP